jgi:hypothetical protein
MAFLSGTTGSVKVGSTVYAFDKWRLSMKGGAPKVTNFAGSGYQQLVPGVKSATITLSGPYNQGAMAVAVNTSYAWILGMDTGVEITVTAQVTGIDVDDSVEDAPRVNVTAESTGSFTASIA